VSVDNPDGGELLLGCAIVGPCLAGRKVARGGGNERRVSVNWTLVAILLRLGPRVSFRSQLEAQFARR
jgi:hypothetical protein